ncbi:MAG: hypothetical protein PHX30_00450 [Candidatus Pacebacteria bacterium]|nr:hypothetical protein [Candidatus Paceibacterota bacterium]
MDLSYEVKENIEKKTTEVIVDLAKNGWPTSGISLSATDKNFNRKFTVYESGDKSSWQSVGQDYIYNYDTPKYVGANLNINYRETSKRYLKIEIVNFDDKPISITGLSTKTILRSIVFQYGSNPAEKVYRLFYGNPKANFPQYDLEKFFSYLDTGKYYGSALSAQQANPYYSQEASPVAPLSERIPYLVPGALVLAIILMGLVVVRFMKKVGAEK